MSVCAYVTDTAVPKEGRRLFEPISIWRVLRLLEEPEVGMRTRLGMFSGREGWG